MIPKGRMVYEGVLRRMTSSSSPSFFCPFYPISTHLLWVTKFMILCITFPLFLHKGVGTYIFYVLLFLTQRVIYYRYLLYFAYFTWQFILEIVSHQFMAILFLRPQSALLCPLAYSAAVLHVTVCVPIHAVTSKAAVNVLLQFNLYVSSG